MKEDALIVAGLGLLVVGLVVLWVFALMWAWNTFVPTVFGGPTIEPVQAAALALLLSAISGGTRYVRSGRND